MSITVFCPFLFFIFNYLFCPFLNWVFGVFFFWHRATRAICIFWRWIPCQLFPLQIFVLVRFLFGLVSFGVQKLLSIIKSHVFIFVFIFGTLRHGSKRMFLQFMSECFFSWLCHATCGILVPWPGMNSGPQQWKCQVLTLGLGFSPLSILASLSQVKQPYVHGEEESTLCCWVLLPQIWAFHLFQRFQVFLIQARSVNVQTDGGEGACSSFRRAVATRKGKEGGCSRTGTGLLSKMS